MLLIMKEHRLSALSILILGAGVAATGAFPSYEGLVFTTLLMSFGFHYYETTNQSLTLQYFDQSASPLVFGRQRAAAAASNIGVGALIFLLSGVLPYADIYLLVGLLVAAVGIWGWRQNPETRQPVVQFKRMILRRRYWLFYLLTFMSGARRQIFVAFAVFLMVKKFDYTVQEVTALFMVNNAVNYFASPMIGKAITRFGERKVMSLEYASLIAIFTAYAFVQSKWVVALLYILDYLFFNFSIAVRTYFQKVGDPADIAPSMSVGFTINHIAAVILPAIGGMLWMMDYRIVFLAGAAMSLMSLLAVQAIRLPRRKTASGP
jgi:predicted MFS family arabinose efflux permease